MSWDVPARTASPIDDAEQVLEDAGHHRPRAHASRSARPTRGDFVKVQVGDQTRRGRAPQLREAFAEAAGVDGRRRQRQPRSAPTWGDEITEKAVRALVDLPRARRDLHLVPLRVADGARGDHRDAARRRHQRRDLLDVPVRRDPGDGDRVPDDPRLLAVRHDRRVRPHQGEREPVRHRQAAVRRPASTSR